MREHDLLPLYDASLNAWPGRDDRTFLIRCLPGDGRSGVARALLPDRYHVTGHLGTR